MPEPEPTDPEPKAIVIGDPSLGSPLVIYGEQGITFYSSQKAFDDQEPLWEKGFEGLILPPFPIPIPERLQYKPDVQRAMLVYTATEKQLLSLEDGRILSTEAI